MSYRLSIIEVSEALGVSVRHVLELIEAGDLTAQTVGRTIMVPQHAIDRYVRTKQPATS